MPNYNVGVWARRKKKGGGPHRLFHLREYDLSAETEKEAVEAALVRADAQGFETRYYNHCVDMDKIRAEQEADLRDRELCRICGEPRHAHVPTEKGALTHPREARGEGKYVLIAAGTFGSTDPGKDETPWERWEFVPAKAGTDGG